MLKLNAFLLILILCISLRICVINVISPEILAKKFSGNIEAKYSLFGMYKYGFSTVSIFFYKIEQQNIL